MATTTAPYQNTTAIFLGLIKNFNAHTKETIKSIFIESCPVDFQENIFSIFESINIEKAQSRRKRAITPTCLNRCVRMLTTDRPHHANYFYLVKIWINLTIFEIYAKIFCLTLMFYL